MPMQAAIMPERFEDSARWRIEDHLCKMVDAAQQAVERAIIARAPDNVKKQLAVDLQTATDRLLDYMMRDILPDNLPEHLRF